MTGPKNVTDDEILRDETTKLPTSAMMLANSHIPHSPFQYTRIFHPHILPILPIPSPYQSKHHAGRRIRSQDAVSRAGSRMPQTRLTLTDMTRSSKAMSSMRNRDSVSFISIDT